MSRKTRKLIWSAPLVAVLAVAGALALFVALTPNAAQAHDLPGPVSDLVAEGTSWSTIKLTWKAPTTGGGGVTGYRIDISTDEFVWESRVMNTGDTRTTYTHSGLKGDQTRYYRVFALNAAGAGPSPVGDEASNDLFVGGTTLPAEAPGQVLNLRATGVSHDQIDVMWNAPTSTGGADIDSYCLIVGAMRDHVVNFTGLVANCTGGDGGASATLAGEDDDGVDTLAGISNELNDAPEVGYLIVIDADKPAGHEGHWPMFEHKDLNAELKLYYRLYAVNEVEPSATATNIVSATTKKTPKPGAPRGLKLVSTGSGALNLYWNWPANALKTEADDFWVQYRSSSVRTWSPAIAVAVSTEFPIQATHTPAAEDYMDFIPRVPGPPVVKARKAATYLEYRVMVGEKGTPSRTATIKLVPPQDPDSATPAQRNPTLPEPIDLPGLTLATSGTAPTAVSTLRTVKITWEREGEPARTDADGPVPAETLPSGFVIDAVMGEADANPVGFQPLQPNTSYTGKVRGTDATSTYTHRGAMPDQDWKYRIFPYSSGSKWYGDPLTLDAMTKPAEAPAQYSCGQVSTADDGPTRITISWPAPGEDGGSAVLGFLVQVGDDEDDDGSDDSSAEGWEMAPLGTLDADARSYTYVPKGDDALSSGSIRWLRVIVLNSVNTHPDTGALLPIEQVDLDSVCAKKGETAASGTPGQPDGLVVEPARDAGSVDADNPVPNSERGVLLLWNAPDDPAGDTVTDYVIARRVRDDSTSAWGDWDEEWAEIDESATSYTDTVIVAELDNGEARQYRVAAQSGSGTGAWTPVVTYPHDQAMHNAAPTPVGTIAAVTVTVGQTTAAMDVSGYFSDADTGDTLTYTASSDMEMYATVSVSGSMLTITGVAAGMATITVTATDMDDAYAMQTIMVTVEAADMTLGVPSGLMTSDATDDPGTLLVKVDWTPGNNAVGHLVMLFTDDWQGAPLVEGMPTGSSHTFTVDAGSYIAVVVAYDADANIQLAISGVTSVGGS